MGTGGVKNKWVHQSYEIAEWITRALFIMKDEAGGNEPFKLNGVGNGIFKAKILGKNWIISIIPEDEKTK